MNAIEWIIPKKLAFGLVLSILCAGCKPCGFDLDPCITFTPPPYYFKQMETPFPKLTSAERSQDWGKELHLGKQFAKDMDLYRAITCFKRALFLIPTKNEERRLEIEYDIFFAYYISNKYQEAIDAFETSSLSKAPKSFPAFHELLVALYDAYIQLEDDEKASRVMLLFSDTDSETARNLTLETAIIKADFPAIACESLDNCHSENIADFVLTYRENAKSITRAQVLNGILPGAGYYYVGQKNSALTSFIINALFIGAAYQLFDRGYIPAAIIVTSLETGWYFGGINGAGLAAAEYNRNLYQKLADNALTQNRLYPLLMIQKGF